MKPIRRRMLSAGAKLWMTAEDMDKWLKDFLHEKNPVCLWDATGCSICEAMFPKLDNKNLRCPHSQFGFSYVRKRTREALEE